MVAIKHFLPQYTSNKIYHVLLLWSKFITVYMYNLFENLSQKPNKIYFKLLTNKRFQLGIVTQINDNQLF